MPLSPEVQALMNRCRQSCPSCTSMDCCTSEHRLNHQFACKRKRDEDGGPVICRHYTSPGKRVKGLRQIIYSSFTVAHRGAP